MHVWDCVMVIAVRRCMRVSKCVLACTRHMLTVIAVRVRMYVLVFVFLCTRHMLMVTAARSCHFSAYAQGAWCVVGVFVWACARRKLTVLFGRPCTHVSECVLLIKIV
jgi:hypothetical protein